MTQPKTIVKIAERQGFTNFIHEPWQLKLRFQRRHYGHYEIIDVWYSTMTVGTTIDHPVKGRSTLFRKHVSLGLLNRIFQYPRLHTQKGYYQRKTMKPWH